MTRANDDPVLPAAGPPDPADPADPADPEDATAEPDVEPASRPRRRTSMGQSIGGVLFGFEQQVWRNQPPPHELVHHARPDSPVPAGDGGFLTIELPADLAVGSGGDDPAGPDGLPAPVPGGEADAGR